MRKQLTFCIFIILPILANAQGITLSCNQDKLLFPKQALPNNKNLDIAADKSKINKKNNYHLTGNVVLKSNEYYLSADDVTVQKINKTSTMRGNVKFQNNEIMLTADSGVLKKQNNVTHSTLEQVKFHYPDTKIKGNAQKIVNDGTKQVFTSSNYSLCPLGNTDWQIKAEQITLNPTDNKGMAKDVVLEFFGIPVFYTPYYEWTLKGRSSGFLAPAFASYDEQDNDDSGYQARIPYYFNIAPDKDFLLTLNQLSTRGSVVEGKYRQLMTANDLWQNGRFEIESHYLNEDDITKDKRWLVDSKLDLAINPKTNLKLTANRVSDKDYFKDIAHNNTSAEALYSNLNLSYKDKNLDMHLFTEAEQIVNDGDASYTRAPELSIAKNIQALSGRNVELSLVSTKFAHKDANITTNKTGVRTHVQAKFTRDITTDAYSLKPSMVLSTTEYSMDDTTDQSRSTGSFDIDSKLFLERDTTLFDIDLTQTLVPRLAYYYTPEKNQNSIQNFDTGAKSFSYYNLFSNQNFTGLDKINNANKFAIGLESSFIDNQTGDTYLGLKIAQAFHINDRTMDIDGNMTDQREYSDIATSVDFTLDNFTINNSLQYDPETGEIDKQNNSITYLLNTRKFLTLAHNDDDDMESAELYGAYPINQKIHVFGGVNRSITDSITNKQTGGVAYESCCWAVRLAHSKKHITDSDYDHVTNFELVLKGLTSTSPNFSKILEEDIPNYLPDLNAL